MPESQAAEVRRVEAARKAARAEHRMCRTIAQRSPLATASRGKRAKNQTCKWLRNENVRNIREDGRAQFYPEAQTHYQEQSSRSRKWAEE